MKTSGIVPVGPIIKTSGIAQVGPILQTSGIVLIGLIKMEWKMSWIQGHVERRKPNQEEWTDEEWINVSADELA